MAARQMENDPGDESERRHLVKRRGLIAGAAALVASAAVLRQSQSVAAQDINSGVFYNAVIPFGDPYVLFANASNLPDGNNVVAVTGWGKGNQEGVRGQGGNNNGFGVQGTGGGPNGVGVRGSGVGTAQGVWGVGGAASGFGVLANGGAPNGIGVSGNGAGTGAGVVGISAGTGDGVLGQSNTGSQTKGVHGKHLTNGYGVYGESGSGGFGAAGVSPDTIGVYGQCNSGSRSAGLYGSHLTNGFGVYGTTASGGYGVTGVSPDAIGVLGQSSSGSGVVGQNTGSGGVGVVGQSDATSSSIGVRGTSNLGFGVYGASNGGPGVFGTTTAAQNAGLAGIASTPGTAAFAGTATVATAYAGFFTGDVFVNGNFTVQDPTRKHGAIQHPGDPAGTLRILYSMESPESWLEDFGKAKVVNGRAEVKLDADFAAVVHTDDYHVFLTEYGDHNALFVDRQTASGFEVHAKGGGTASGLFSWRVVAKPKSERKAERLAKFTPPTMKVPDLGAIAKTESVPIKTPPPTKP